MSKPLSKEAKAQMLYKLGYRAALSGDAVLVRNPAGTRYSIDIVRHTCSCPYTGECCHLLGLHSLLLDQSNALSLQASEMRDERGRWSDEGLRVAGRGARLSDRAFDVLLAWEGMRRAA